MSSMVITHGQTAGQGVGVRARQMSTAARPSASQSSLRLTARGRWVLVIALLAVIGAFMILRAPGAIADAPAQGEQVRNYVVQPGDTLWGLASEVAAPGVDLRDVVADLADLNGLKDQSLAAGQEIILPVRG